MADRLISEAQDGELTVLDGSELFEVEQDGQVLDLKLQSRTIGLVRRVTQTAHGIAAQRAVGVNGAGDLVLADASTGVAAVAFVLEVIDANTLRIGYLGRQVCSAAHGLTLGAQYLLGTGGQLVTTPTPGIRVQHVLTPVSATDVLLQMGVMV